MHFLTFDRDRELFLTEMKWRRKFVVNGIVTTIMKVVSIYFQFILISSYLERKLESKSMHALKFRECDQVTANHLTSRLQFALSDWFILRKK